MLGCARRTRRLNAGSPAGALVDAGGDDSWKRPILDVRVRAAYWPGSGCGNRDPSPGGHPFGPRRLPIRPAVGEGVSAGLDQRKADQAALQSAAACQHARPRGVTREVDRYV